MTGTPLDVTAIVISYNSEERIAEAVTAHEKALEHLDAEVLVVDNASSDDSVARARNAIRRGRVIANKENLGYGEAANQGVSEARGRTCLILNDDARIDPRAIDEMLAALFASPDIALVGPRIIDELGNPMPAARMTFPGPSEEVERLRARLRGINLNALYPIVGEQPREVAWLVAACVLGRTDVLRRAGGFNPAFFLYAEDIDLCRRLRILGYRILTVPSAVCVHTGSVSTGAAFGRGASIDRRMRARDIYYRIWHRRPVRSIIHLWRAIGLSNQPQRLQYHLPRVFWDGRSLRHLRQPAPLEPRHGLSNQ